MVMMKQYVLKRFFLLLPTFLGITGLTFFMLQLAPGDPAALKAQSFTELLADPQQTEAVVTETQKLYGLEKPLSLQYLLWLKRIVLFDFGESYRDHRPVMAKIAEALPITLLLNALTLLVIFVIAFPLGAYNALKPNSFHDRVSALFLFLLYSLPSFWFALLLIVLFAGGDYLNLFPLIGIFSDGAERLPWFGRIGNLLWHLILPVIVLSVANIAFLSRFVRASLVEVMKKEYIRTAYAKGLSPFQVMVKHAFKNALLPLVTLFGSLLPALLSGSVIVEQIFSIPGMGRLSFESVLARDYPVIMGITVMTATLMLISYFVTDIVYGFLDPRLRLHERRGL